MWTLSKLFKTARNGEKVSSNCPLYSDTKKWKISKQKNCKNKTVLQGFASTYNVEVLNSFNPQLQLKDAEFAIKCKLIELLTRLKGFKFVITLNLVFKKIKREDKSKYDNIYSNSKAEIIINESDTDDLF